MGREQMLFLVKDFKFENEVILPQVDNRTRRRVGYDYTMDPTNILILNNMEGLLHFTFKLKMLPNICQIKFEGDCILYTRHIKTMVLILKSKENTELRIKNKPLIKALSKLLSRRCLDYAKEIGEKENIRFPNYERILERFGMDKITFKNLTSKDVDTRPILKLMKDKLIEKE